MAQSAANPTLALSSLLSPVSLGSLELKNRVVLAPLTRARAGSTRLANALMAEYYAQRASAGLLISEATTVSAQGNGWVGSPGIYTNEQRDAWKPVVDVVHEAGGVFFLQLWHTGRASHSDFHGGELPVAPSAIAIDDPQGLHTPAGPEKKPYEVPRALREDELPGVVADYRAAAQRAKDAGFDGVEVHAANGYLLDQFLQSTSNRRADGYGGSIEKRYRLLKEVVEAVLEVFPADRVGVRLAPNGAFNGMGSPDFRETFLYVAGQLDAYGLAYLHVLDGLAFGFHGQGEALTLDDLRDVYRGRLMGNCGYEASTADEAIRAGRADLIAFGRAYLANPDLVERFQNAWPLAPIPDPSTWYSGEPLAEGYTTFPPYDPQN